MTLAALAAGAFLLLSEVAKAWAPPTVEELVLADAPRDLRNVRASVDVAFFALRCDKIHVKLLSNGDHREHDLTSEMALSPVGRDGEGCVVKGDVRIPSGAGGDLHVALTPHVLADRQAVGVTLNDFAKFNASHSIRELRFYATPEAPWGSDDGGASAPGKLDGTLNVHHANTAHYMYHLHVVPVVTRGRAVHRAAPPTASQLRLPYNVRQNHVTSSIIEVVSALQRLGLPGLYLSYEFSHLVVQRSQPRVDLVELAIHAIGVVGGVSVIAAVLDTALHLSFANLKRKLD